MAEISSITSKRMMSFPFSSYRFVADHRQRIGIAAGMTAAGNVLTAAYKFERETSLFS